MAVFDKLIFSRLRFGIVRRLVYIPALGKPPEEKELSAADCTRKFAHKGGRTRSRSPSKRPRAEMNPADGCHCDESDREDDENRSEDEDRGRPRKRPRNKYGTPSLSRSVLSLETSPEPPQAASNEVASREGGRMLYTTYKNMA